MKPRGMKKEKAKGWNFRFLISDGMGNVWHEYEVKATEDYSIDMVAQTFIRAMREAL